MFWGSQTAQGGISVEHKWTFLDSDTLKIIAIVTMLIDHTGASLLETILYSGNTGIPDYWYEVDTVFRCIGRTAFPIFAFLLAEGFFHTHSRKKYLERLLFFAVLSEIPFNLAFHGFLFYPGSQNVFWTFCIGFLVIWGLERLYAVYAAGSDILKKNKERRGRRMNRGLKFVFPALGLVLAGAVMASVMQADYGLYGFLLILLFYLGRRGNAPRIVVCICGYLLFLWEPYCLFGFLLILFYNGKRKQRGKGFQYFFYLFYPVHLLIFGLIRVVFLGD